MPSVELAEIKVEKRTLPWMRAHTESTGPRKRRKSTFSQLMQQPTGFLPYRSQSSPEHDQRSSPPEESESSDEVTNPEDKSLNKGIRSLRVDRGKRFQRHIQGIRLGNTIAASEEYIGKGRI